MPTIFKIPLALVLLIITLIVKSSPLAILIGLGAIYFAYNGIVDILDDNNG